VARQGSEARIRDIFERWGLDCVTVGEVTDDGRFRARYRGEEVASIPVDALTEAAPAYHRPLTEPQRSAGTRLDVVSLAQPDDLGRVLRGLLATPNLCSRRWVYEQYDSYVGGNTLVQPGGDAAVVRVRETGGALAMTTDCNARYVALDPYLGAQHAVAEAVRNIAVTGGRAAAMSDCLNFGNPEKPEVMWQFSRAIDGMSEACRAFETPVVSGNVSFYNDTLGASIPPTPVVAMVGIVADARRTASVALKRAGDALFLAGDGIPELEASEYLHVVHGLTGDRPPALDLAAERRLAELCASLIEDALVDTAHDLADGGLAVALSEMCLAGRPMIGCEIELAAGERRDDLELFGESGARALIACGPDSSAALEDRARALGVSLRRIGTSGGERLVIRRAGRALVDEGLDALAAGWLAAFGNIADGEYRRPEL
jgi:phosphoribosylformylglycinamidine synthase